MAYVNDCLYFGADDTFGVLCHGDAWSNNMLYRFNEHGVAEDIRVLDWQFIQYGSPAVDLLYFIFISTDKTLRDKEYANMLKWYYESMSRTVNALGSNPVELFTFDNLQQEMKRSGNMILIALPLWLQFILADTSNDELGEIFDKIAEDDDEPVGSSELGGQAKRQFDLCMNDVFEDIVRLGLHRQLKLDEQ